MNTRQANLALQRLEQAGGERLVQEVLAVFRAQIPPKLKAARDAAGQGDAPGVARLAHSLRSSCGQVGATDLMDRLAAVEEHAQRGDLATAPAELETLNADLETFLASLPDPAPAPRDGSRRRRVGVVEDNDDTRLIVRAILEPVFDVDECATGQEALERFERRPPDAVLLDISLPGIDGIEVLARLRADPRTARIPVVALTAHAMVGDRERFLAQGFDGYASKPILDERDLIATVRAALEGSA